MPRLMSGPSEETLLEDMYSNVSGKCCDEENLKLNGFLSMEGSNYNACEEIRLMVVGQAPNGWGDVIDCPSGGGIYSRVKDSVTERIHGKCPMSWVNLCDLSPISPRFPLMAIGPHYPAAGIDFWAVIKCVACGLGFKCDDWYSYIVYSNLYKLSPSGKGNPKGCLKRAQLYDCIKMLKLEIETYKPTHLLFLTNTKTKTEFWFDNFECIFVHPLLSVTSGFVKKYDRSCSLGHPTTFTDKFKIVVTEHPSRAKGTVVATKVRDILAYF
ncbi:hypothetical protein [Candidatus Magnetominusculus xianensis]|uniref:Uncharacterized protein n=1 Tax=Candidatus Magnetominusculus xianensis TaxID=1748249 RepID=A0ABR5SI05_9BACT|nr:hypothetical protein [Candidatus Magnetominusculus xianensis]KWT90124.1 hypothetical protein ASN18_1130 [Candidatus Magnetominusculus xianensis]MBF0403617.1 hypothetical protein [Nitrospirota bacterium]